MAEVLHTNRDLDSEKLHRNLWEQIILGVAHELNNPNSFVRLNAMTIKKLMGMLAPCFDEYEERHPGETFGKFNLPELRSKLSQLADGILEASVRIITIADKLKDLSSFSLSQATELSISELVRNMIKMHQFVVEQLAGVELICDASKPYKMEGHSLQLDQAFSILFTNASDAIRDRHGAETKNQGKIAIELKEDDKSVILHFRDNGCGMDQATMEKIFTPYFTTKPQGVGDGLGLSLCQSIIERHGGKIHVKSEKNQGTEFTVVLPKNQ